MPVEMPRDPRGCQGVELESDPPGRNTQGRSSVFHNVYSCDSLSLPCSTTLNLEFVASYNRYNNHYDDSIIDRATVQSCSRFPAVLPLSLFSRWLFSLSTVYPSMSAVLLDEFVEFIIVD